MTKVLIHGNPEVDAIWRPLVATLSERGIDVVILLSPPGFGAPTPDGWEASRASYVHWLIDELESIGAQTGTPVDVVGHDWGAGHVYGLLDERPDLVRSWACDVAGLLHPDYVWHDMAQAWTTPEVGEQVIDAMVAMSLDERRAAFAGLGLPDDVLTEVAAGVDAEMGRCILALYRDAAQPAMAELGGRLAGADLPPGMVINATADSYVSTDFSADVANRLGARSLVLDGNDHWWMTEDPGTAAAGLSSFWDSLR